MLTFNFNREQTEEKTTLKQSLRRTVSLDQIKTTEFCPNPPEVDCCCGKAQEDRTRKVKRSPQT